MQVELGSYIYISLFALGAWGRGVLWNMTGRFPPFANNNKQFRRAFSRRGNNLRPSACHLRTAIKTVFSAQIAKLLATSRSRRVGSRLRSSSARQAATR